MLEPGLHPHLCVACRRPWTCGKPDNCNAEHEGLCDPCFEAVAAELPVWARN